MACKQLSVYGSARRSPNWPSYFPMSSWPPGSRIALEAIPGAAADEALRKASESLQGRLLVGVINSIGVRRDTSAVELLVGRLKDKDADVASAAAVALGHIGNAAAATAAPQSAARRRRSKVRSAVAEGCVLCAERFLAEGNGCRSSGNLRRSPQGRSSQAANRWKRRAARSSPAGRRHSAPASSSSAHRTKDCSRSALSTAREFPGDEVDNALGRRTRRGPARAGRAGHRRHGRPQGHGRSACRAEGRPARADAGSPGGDRRPGPRWRCNLPRAAAGHRDRIRSPKSAKTAKEALADLPGDGVDKEIVARLAKAEGKTYPVLIELVGQRRIEATAALLKALNSSDRAVRSAALTALGNTVPDKYCRC